MKNFFIKITPISLSLIFGVVVNILVFKDIKFFYLRETLSSLYLLIMPGLYISWGAKITFKNIWEFISYTVGLSISALMLIGLGINFLLPALGITNPLSLTPVLASIDVLSILLSIHIFSQNTPFPIEKLPKTISFRNILLASMPLFFPITSIVGAISLNNNQTNLYTMIVLGSIASFVIILTILRDKISNHLFPYTLFMISLSLLFMTSLRGWYITGHDINLEYFVFQLTKSHGIWQMKNFQDPYNACLSITILPTIFSVITRISDYYIYKVLYQIIFSISIIATYLFIKKIINPFFAFLASFIIVSFPTFMTDMPMLNRQEIAFLFFTLLITTVFTKTSSLKKKWFWFILFGIGLAFSHYSTTYITLSLFGLSALVYLLISIFRIHPHIKNMSDKLDFKLGLEHHQQSLRLEMVIFLLILTIIWNFSVTHISNGILTTINNIKQDFTTVRTINSKNDPGSYSVLSSKKPSDSQLLMSYVNTLTKYVRRFNDDSAFLPENIYNQYRVTLGAQEKLPLNSLGQTLKNNKINVFRIFNFLKDAYAKIVQLLIVIGFICLFWYKKYTKKLKKEYIILTFVFFGFLVAETILPSGSINYGILRLLQQSLILLSIPLIIGALVILSIFDKIHQSIKIYLLSFILIFFFLYLSGFLPTLTGGYYPQLNLSNAGFYYEAYYTHTEEFASINWLVKNANKNIPIQSDWFTGNKIHTYGHVYSIDAFIPSVIRINSYVYVSYSNIKTGQVMVYVNGSPIYYYFPFKALDDNKNLIYNNGGSKIYR